MFSSQPPSAGRFGGDTQCPCSVRGCFQDTEPYDQRWSVPMDGAGNVLGKIVRDDGLCQTNNALPRRRFQNGGMTDLNLATQVMMHACIRSNSPPCYDDNNPASWVICRSARLRVRTDGMTSHRRYDSDDPHACCSASAHPNTWDDGDDPHAFWSHVRNTLSLGSAPNRQSFHLMNLPDRCSVLIHV